MQATGTAQDLTENSPFDFACKDDLPCFTQCCKDVNIYLTPYDVLRLRKTLGISSSGFLEKYARSFLSKVGNIPVVQLLMDPQTLYCPFVSEEGCQVYEDRPWACRMFPLDLASTTDAKFRIIAGKERCKGLFERSKGTVKDWLQSQGVLEYSQMDREFQSVVPGSFKPGAPMNEGLGRVLFMAYDLDRFAELLEDSRFLNFHEIDDETLSLAGKDTKELLRLAFRYIRSQLEELYQLV